MKLFEIEALEPRVLLSGDGVGLVASEMPPEASAAPDAVEVETMWQTDTSAQETGGADLFSGVASEPP